MRARSGRQPALRHRLRRAARRARRDHQKPPAGPPPIEAPKNDLSWRDCTSRVFSDAAVPPLPGVTLDCASYDADLDPINGATGTVSIGVVRATSAADPAGRRPAGHDDRFGPAVVGAAAGVAVARRRRRAQDPPDRRGRPPRHRACRAHLDCRDLFDRQEMLDQAQFAVRRRPGRQPRRDHHDRDHELHRHHRPRRLGLRQRARRRGHRAAAQHLGRADDRAARHRQRRPGRARLRRLAPEQGGPAGARLAAAARRSPPRPPTEQQRQGRAGRAGRVRRAVRRHQLPAGPGPEGRDRRAAGGRAQPATGPAGRRSPTVADAISTALAYPRGDRVDSDQQPGRQRWPRRAPATPTS